MNKKGYWILDTRIEPDGLVTLITCSRCFTRLHFLQSNKWLKVENCPYCHSINKNFYNIYSKWFFTKENYLEMEEAQEVIDESFN